MAFELPNLDAVAAGYERISRVYNSDWQIQANSHSFYSMYTGGDIAVGTNFGTIKVNAGHNFCGTTEIAFAALDNQNCLRTANATTVGAASAGVHTNTFLGSGSLTVASTTGFPASGVLYVYNTTASVDVISYTSTDATHFLGCTLAGGADITLTTGDTVLGSNVDVTNPKWILVEMGVTGTCSMNIGTAATDPVPPSPTANKVVHAAVYVPALVTAVDLLYNTANAKAKIIDKRVVKAPLVRPFAADAGLGNLTNPRTALPNAGSTLLAALPRAYANSTRVGDMYRIITGGFYKNVTNTNDLNIIIYAGSNVLLDVTWPSLTAATNQRYWNIEVEIQAVTSTAFTRLRTQSAISAGAAAAGTSPASVPAAGSITWAGTVGGAWTFGSDQDFDIQAVLTGTSTAAAFVALKLFTIEKMQAPS